MCSAHIALLLPSVYDWSLNGQANVSVLFLTGQPNIVVLF